jgi:chorismate mutase / prephenate dehydratase
VTPADPPARVCTLGPAGTYSDAAARKLLAHLKQPDVPIEYTRTIPEALERAEADATAWAVTPIENSDVGTVVQAQDALVRHALTAIWEVSLRIRFSALSRAPAEQVLTLHAHPVAFEQCSSFVTARLPKAKVTFADSNAAAGLRFLESAPMEPVAAIVPMEFGAVHAAHLLQADVQNFANNTTRFLAVRRRAEPERFDFTRRKTALYIEPKEDRPGLLYGLLSVFNTYDLNLSRLESRPDRVAPWQYVFFIDVTNAVGTAQCLDDLRRTGHRITVLGSFDTVE